DKPDFIIYAKKKIGVEITQIYKDDQESQKGSLLKSLEEYTIRISEEIIELLKKHQKPKCIIAIHLNKNAFPAEINPKQIALFIFNDINKNVNFSKTKYYLEIENIGQLPNLIDSYKILINNNYQNYGFIELYSSVGGKIDN